MKPRKIESADFLKQNPIGTVIETTDGISLVAESTAKRPMIVKLYDSRSIDALCGTAEEWDLSFKVSSGGEKTYMSKKYWYTIGPENENFSYLMEQLTAAGF